MRIVALHAGHKRHAHVPCQKRIFAIRLLPAAPARIAEDVDVRRPEIQPLENVAVPRAHILRMLDAPLGADVDGHLVNLRRVEGRAKPDRLGKLRRPIHRHAVQSLAPPVVRRHIQPRNRARLVHQLRSLLFERHPLHQVGSALLRRQAGVQIGRLLRILSPRRARHSAADQTRRNRSQSKALHLNLPEQTEILLAPFQDGKGICLSYGCQP